MCDTIFLRIRFSTYPSSALQAFGSPAEIEYALKACEIEIDCRPETLDLNDYLRLYSELQMDARLSASN